MRCKYRTINNVYSGSPRNGCWGCVSASFWCSFCSDSSYASFVGSGWKKWLGSSTWDGLALLRFAFLARFCLVEAVMFILLPLTRSMCASISEMLNNTWENQYDEENYERNQNWASLNIFWILEAEMLNNTFWFINPKRIATEKKKTNKPPNVWANVNHRFV